jgi:hypothetical protein
MTTLQPETNNLSHDKTHRDCIGSVAILQHGSVNAICRKSETTN